MSLAMLCWIQCARPIRANSADVEQHMRRKRNHASTIWSPFVIASLSSTPRMSEICRCPASTDARDWEAAQSHLQYNILGLAAVQALWTADPVRYLSAQQREVVRFWWDMLGQDFPLVFLIYSCVHVQGSAAGTCSGCPKFWPQQPSASQPCL